jgi:hypothetical protein
VSDALTVSSAENVGLVALASNAKRRRRRVLLRLDESVLASIS